MKEKKRNVLLLNPPYINVVYDFKQEFSVEYPLGLAYLAGTLEADGIPYDILDANAQGYSIQSTAQKVKDLAPDIIGITSTTTTIMLVSKVVQMCKELLPNLIVIVGGPHTTSLPEKTLQDFPMFDYLCQGDGELILSELYHTLTAGILIESDEGRWRPAEHKGGIWFKSKSGEIEHYETIREFDHMDDIPFPCRNKFPNDRYSVGPLMNIGYKGIEIVKLAGSRGCPSACVFCSEGKKWPAYRYRSPESIVREIEHYYYNEGARHFFFVDDTINVRTKDLITMSEMIIKSDMKLKWHCYARVHPINDEILSVMKKSGCFGLMYGVESGDPDLIKTLGKNVTIEQVTNAVKLAKKYNMKVLTFFMFGLPGDTPETCLRTINFAKKLNADLAFFSMTVPYPGTKLYDDYVKKGLLSENVAWDSFTQHKKNSDHYSDGLTTTQVLHYYRKAHVSFYLRPRFWGRIIRRMFHHPIEIRNNWWLLREFITTFK